MIKNQPRHTIAVLVDYTDTEFQRGILSGIDHEARQRDINIIIIEGGLIKSDNISKMRQNIIFKLAQSGKIDALILFSASIGMYLTDSEFEEFIHPFHDIPIISMSRELAGLSSILVNNNLGMIDMLDHLVKDHQYRKFLYVRGVAGNYDDEERIAVFRSYLAEKGIPFDKNSIIQGNYILGTAMDAFEEYLADNELDQDVIVCANDEMAVGIGRVLKKRGVSVPEDIAIVGFDNFMNSRYLSPPLSTVSQPLFKLGQNAVESACQQLHAGKSTLTIYLPSSFIRRESCGCCGMKSVNRLPDISANHPFDEESFCRYITPRLKDSVEHSLSVILIQHSQNDIAEAAKAIIHSFIHSVFQNDQNIFLELWRSFLKSTRRFEQDYIILRDLISTISTIITDKVSSPENIFTIQEIWKCSVDYLAKKCVMEEKLSNLDLDIDGRIIDEIRFTLISSTDIEEYLTLVQKAISHLEIDNCFATLFDDNSVDSTLPEKSTLLFGFKNGTITDKNGSMKKFNTLDILPKECLPTDERFSLHIELLTTSSQRIGLLCADFNITKLRSIRGFRQVLSNSLFSRNLVIQVKQQQKDLEKNIAIIRRTMGGFIQTLQQTVELRDPYTAGHQRRVSELARMIAQEMGLTKQVIETVRVGGVIHDLGKINIPVEILNKPGKLRDVEMSLLRTHPEIAYEILLPIDFPWAIADVVVQHHEHLDGTGYPKGLKKDEILLEAKIICVADVVEAMASHRPYRPALGLDIALEEILNKRNSWFDADIVDTCIFLLQSGKYTLS
ncbi:MAG: substrate-binding domain-containing protein [Spirochaetes bacterium]|nr:substrate-binding domain-containing protein [Spirochaetota bacterium]